MPKQMLAVASQGSSQLLVSTRPNPVPQQPSSPAQQHNRYARNEQVKSFVDTYLPLATSESATRWATNPRFKFFPHSVSRLMLALQLAHILADGPRLVRPYVLA